MCVRIIPDCKRYRISVQRIVAHLAPTVPVPHLEEARFRRTVPQCVCGLRVLAKPQVQPIPVSPCSPTEALIGLIGRCRLHRQIRVRLDLRPIIQLRITTVLPQRQAASRGYAIANVRSGGCKSQIDMTAEGLLESSTKPNPMTGCAPQQVHDFLDTGLPILNGRFGENWLALKVAHPTSNSMIWSL